MANFYAQYPASSGGTGSNASVGVNGITAPTSSTEVAGVNPSGNLQPLQTDAAGNLKVNLATETQNPLPVTDAAAEASLASIDSKTPTVGQKTSAASSPVVIASDQSTLPISAASLPLPAGAATNAELVIINSTLGSPFQAGGSIGNTSFAATQATASALNATVVGPSGVALAKDSSLTTINTTLGTPMQQTGGSLSVTNFPATQPVSGSVSVSNFPATQPVSGTVAVSSLPALPAGSNAIGSVSVSNLPSEQAVNLNQVGGSSLSIGQQLSAASLPVVLPAAQITALTPPTSVTSTPTSGALTDGSGTITTASTSQQIFAATTRKYLFVQNLSPSATMYLNFGSAASAGAGSIAILPYGSFVQETAFTTNQTVNILSATASAPFTAKQA